MIRTILALVMLCPVAASGAMTQERYYAHEAVADRHGVIAPWYAGQNGQCDFRIRVAAETMKRYPWTDTKKAVAAAPAYVFSGAWQIAPDGTITLPDISDWANGDLGQRASYVLSGLIDYYRYSGDATAIGHITAQADALLDHCLTPDDHPWPRFLISCPTKGKPWGRCDPGGFIQLDIVAEVGVPLIRAAQLTGNERWFAAAKHWGDLLAAKRSREPGVAPWNRYANPEAVPWEDHQTGGIVFILAFFDELIAAGYAGQDNAIVEARDAGRAYLRDVLLPRWTVNDVWGRNYWDWNDPVQAENVTEFAARYLMENPDVFPNWRNDSRNILTLFLNHTSVAPNSRGDVYHGAWAYPESSSCCGRSLWYGPLELVNTYAQYGVLAESEWARELARRQLILATYDAHETGVVEDNIDGGQVVAGAWFKIAHPMALRYCLAAVAWMPDLFGPARENHIVRSASVVTNVVYGDGRIVYTTATAPAGCVDVLRLAFPPTIVAADGKPLAERSIDRENGYRLQPLPCGDFILTVRHDGCKEITIEGDDPQEAVDAGGLDGRAGASVTARFTGNQVRILGRVGSDGGRADVYLDGVRQLVGIDAWNPSPRDRQVLYYRNGLADGEHTLKIVAAGQGNPLSHGAVMRVDAVLASAATGANGFGEGGGPAGPQRWIFGYTDRIDWVDSQGKVWKPAMEFIVRSGVGADSVAALWTRPTRHTIFGTPDAELYRYGIHGHWFNAHFTVGPGRYSARIKLAESRNVAPNLRAVTIRINGREVVTRMDVAATAGGMARAVDLVFNDLEPKNGMIDIQFANDDGGEAMVQAIEVVPGDGGRGATPVTLPPPTTSTAPAAKEK